MWYCAITSNIAAGHNQHQPRPHRRRGLGAPVALYLAAAGVGTVGIIDGDVVDLSNLQRQVIHFTPDVGKAKVLSAKEKINLLNPDVNVVTYQTLSPQKYK